MAVDDQPSDEGAELMDCEGEELDIAMLEEEVEDEAEDVEEDDAGELPSSSN